ncbi:MAG: lactate utilization protein [Clostridiales bacterium]|nr:lactate utilization protein [Clostridiales bacterium]
MLCDDKRIPIYSRRNIIHSIKKNYENRNIEFEYYENREELLLAVKSEMKLYNSIGIGNSQTLKGLKVSEMAISMDKTVYDKTLASTQEDIRKTKKEALTAECYISSCNALTRDGKIINIDHSGNRVAAITYGPERVLLIVGSNKLADNEQEGIRRALKIATPLNAKRAKINSSCSRGESCDTCNQEIRVCNYISVIRGQYVKGRMKVFMIDESLGF